MNRGLRTIGFPVRQTVVPCTCVIEMHAPTYNNASIYSTPVTRDWENRGVNASNTDYTGYGTQPAIYAISLVCYSILSEQ